MVTLHYQVSKEAGCGGEVIKAILGHSSIVTSRGYMSASRTMTRAAMERVAERLQLTGADGHAASARGAVAAGEPAEARTPAPPDGRVAR